MDVIKRALLHKIKKSLQNFPCVVLIGARQVGRTTILKQVLPDANYYDLEKESDYKIISSDPEYFLSQAKYPLVIDEAQLLKNISESLAGRVAIIEIPSFDWQECFDIKESLFAKHIFEPQNLLTLKLVPIKSKSQN